MGKLFIVTLVHKIIYVEEMYYVMFQMSCSIFYIINDQTFLRDVPNFLGHS